jgi:hypothetical protein
VHTSALHITSSRTFVCWVQYRNFSLDGMPLRLHSRNSLRAPSQTFDKAKQHRLIQAQYYTAWHPPQIPTICQQQSEPFSAHFALKLSALNPCFNSPCNSPCFTLPYTSCMPSIDTRFLSSTEDATTETKTPVAPSCVRSNAVPLATLSALGQSTNASPVYSPSTLFTRRICPSPMAQPSKNCIRDATLNPLRRDNVVV